MGAGIVVSPEIETSILFVESRLPTIPSSSASGRDSVEISKRSDGDSHVS